MVSCNSPLRRVNICSLAETIRYSYRTGAFTSSNARRVSSAMVRANAFDPLVGAILVALLRPPTLLLLARVAGRLELNAAIPGLPFHQPEEGVPLIGGDDGVGRIVVRGADELAQRRDGTDGETGVDRDVERNRLEYPLVMAGDDDDPCRRGIELLIEVGRQSLHIGREALECRTARTVAIDRLVEITPELLPRRATWGAILLTRRTPLGSLWLGRLETTWRWSLPAANRG